MVTGNGLIASQFYDYHLNPDVIIFASGVSNSAGNDEKAFERERNLLTATWEQHRGKKLVYFSTCSIYDPSLQNSAYVKHKLQMEQWILAQNATHLVFRLSNPIGKYNNPHTFFNFFADHVRSGSPFEIWAHAERNIIDADDFYRLAKTIIDDPAYNNQVINIANPENYKVTEIVHAIEKYFNKKGNYTIADKGNSLFIDTAIVQALSPGLHIDFKTNYINRLLQKYFPV